MDEKLVEEVYKKTNNHCGFPECNVAEKEHLEIHHIYSKGIGGNSQLQNLILLCKWHHRIAKNAVHLCYESMKLIQQLFAPNKAICMINRKEIADTKRKRKGLNKAISEKRKSDYQKLKNSKPKAVKDKDINAFRERLRLGKIK